MQKYLYDTTSVQNRSIKEFTDGIQDHLNQGWECIGGPYAVQTKRPESITVYHLHIQVMQKKTLNPEWEAAWDKEMEQRIKQITA